VTDSTNQGAEPANEARRPSETPGAHPFDDPSCGRDVLVRVGIVSWNTAELLDACLAALPAALDGIPAEVVVVDNASSDASVEVARRHGVEVIANQANRGYAAAMNQALARPWPAVLIALNPDTVPPPGSLARLVKHLLAGPPDVGLLVPRLLNTDGSEQHSVRTFGSPAANAVVWFVPRRLQRNSLGRRYWLDGMAPHDRSQDIDWAIGAVHVIRSAALADRQAAYDEQWFMYVEDVELCWWLAQNGWRRRLDVTAEVVHVGNAAGAQMWGDSRVRRYMKATYEWYARDRGAGQARAWAAVNIVGMIWWSLVHCGWAAVRLRRSAALDSLRVLQDLPVHVKGLVAPGGTRR
jgi:N-acetylglucosaminyl-diphospho-decaprenol L-rhamnosyltransferase